MDFTLTRNSFVANVPIINDNMQEIPASENLTATLTFVSANVAVTLDPDTAYVTILDDDSRQTKLTHAHTDSYIQTPPPTDVTVIGFDPDTFTVTEDAGMVEICAAVLEPSDPSLLDPSFMASVQFSLEDGNATGKNHNKAKETFLIYSSYFSSCSSK